MSFILLSDVSNNKSSGTNVYLQELVNILKSREYDFKIVFEGDVSSIDFVKSIHDDYFFIKRRPALFNNLVFGLLWDLYIYLKIFGFNSKIIISTGSVSKYWGVIALSNNAKIICHTYPKLKLTKRHFLFKFVSGFFFKKNSIYTVSNYSKKEFRDKLGLLDVGVIYNYSKLAGIGRKQNFDMILPYNILTVGNFTSYKNVEVWYQVAKELIENGANVKFTWCGDGELLEFYRQRVIEDELKNNIILLGHVKAINVEYSKADIYFQPSNIENHSLSVLDALSYGLPCVLSDVGGMKETASQKSAFFAKPADVGAFSIYLNQLINNHEIYTAMSNSARFEFENKFDKNVFCQRLIEEGFI